MNTLIEQIKPTNISSNGFKTALIHDDTYTKVKEYSNPQVLEKFKDEWDFSDENIIDIFNEMKNFLYLSTISQKENFNIEIHEPLLVIDKMWHIFMQFTEDYTTFCNDFFGFFLHHRPFSKTTLERTIAALKTEGKTYSAEKRTQLSKQLELIEKTFGFDHVKKWYIDYAVDYSPEILIAALRPVFHDSESHINPLLDKNIINQMSKNDLKSTIIGIYSSSCFCGGAGCGRYCTCNSNGSSGSGGGTQKICI